MAKSLSQILQRATPPADSLEEDMRQLVRERPRTNALTEEAQQLISQSMVQAAEQLVQEATAAAAKYRDDAQAQYDQVVEWGKVLISQTEKAAAEIAESHAGMLRSAAHFRAAMSPAVKTGNDDSPTSET